MVESPKPEEQPSETDSTLTLIVEQIRARGIENPVLRIATPVILIALVVLVVLAMRSFTGSMQASNQADLQATAVAMAAPTLGIEEGALPLQNMPEYIVPQSLILGGIPRLINMETIIPSRARVNVLVYDVEQGDNVFAIAEKFDLRPETILWGNYISLNDDPRYISPGDQLNILPVDGVYRQYNIGESLVDIADSLNTSVDAILEWPGNALDPYETDPENPQIADGHWLIVPGGSRDIPDWGPPAITRDNPAVASYYGAGACGAITEGPNGNGFFVWPTPQTTLSGFDWSPPLHNGIDIGGAEGNAVYASDSGVVVYSGWSDFGFGFLIVIDHGGGLQTAYAHLSGVGVVCGQGVSQGLQIGNVGNTGNSSGPHLHFEVTQNGTKVNPWFYVSP